VALVRKNIVCYIRYMCVQSEFISLLDIIAIQRLKMNIFTVQNIRNLLVQI
jgi:hypothetical protein